MNIYVKCPDCGQEKAKNDALNNKYIFTCRCTGQLKEILTNEVFFLKIDVKKLYSIIYNEKIKYDLEIGTSGDDKIIYFLTFTQGNIAVHKEILFDNVKNKIHQYYNYPNNLRIESFKKEVNDVIFCLKFEHN